MEVIKYENEYEKFLKFVGKRLENSRKRPVFAQVTIINEPNKMRLKICLAALEEVWGFGVQSWVSSDCYLAMSLFE